MLGAYTNGELRHFGYAGSGFSEKGLKDAVEKMKPLLTEKGPFVNPPNIHLRLTLVASKRATAPMPGAEQLTLENT